jgi:hypothetical protein
MTRWAAAAAVAAAAAAQAEAASKALVALLNSVMQLLTAVHGFLVRLAAYPASMHALSCRLNFFLCICHVFLPAVCGAFKRCNEGHVLLPLN